MSTDRRMFLATVGLGTAGFAFPAAAGAAQNLPEQPGGIEPSASGVTLDPRDFGATGDGTTMDTDALQTALDRCAVMGGGTVVLSGGTYLTGAVRIGSATTLRIESDAELHGSPDLADYPVTQVRWEGKWIPGHIGLIWARDATNVTLAGKGKIIASQAIEGRVAESGLRNPALMEFVAVRGLRVSDLDTRQNGMWSIHPVYCEDATFRDLEVRGGADGIDLDSCARVLIEDCRFDTVDDCIALKSGRGMEGNRIGRPTEDVTIRNCVFRDHRWACIAIGSEMSGGIRRVLVEHCDCQLAHTFAVYMKGRPGRGAFVEDITMRDLTVSGAGYGFLRLNFLNSGKHDQFPVPGREGIPTLRNFTFERIAVTDVPILVEAVNIHPDKPLQGFVLKDVRGTCGQGITLANMRDVVIEDVDVNVFSGPLVAASNVTGKGLDEAPALVPPETPPSVKPADRPYRLGMPSGGAN